ncbi:MAG: DNA-binding response regulator [Bdellovibrionales bacterium RBG_16_40_8]|nr:MAG: DNA-binding response regulator [Bdellovibrionales bacterium RBG_16_40_8]
MRYNLVLKGYSVKVFFSGEEGLNAIARKSPDLLILDIMLPGLSGLEVCEALRKHKKEKYLPLIMVSAKGEENDVVKGLELGADDYVTKPFSTAVLNARVEAVLRNRRDSEAAHVEVIKLPGLEINANKAEVIINSQKVDLTQSEFKILHFLAQRPGFVYTRGQIVEAIRGENYTVTERAIDFQMVGLRKKIGDKGELIETIRGVGYRFKNIDEGKDQT